MNDDMSLLAEYARTRSDEAFATLLSRHLDLVYSVAVRYARDPHLAQDVTQNVFILLAQKAGSLDTKTILAGWLCRTARYLAANALTMQRRREQREQEAYMQSLSDESAADDAWPQIEPLLEAALTELNEKDHDALVLRFFQGRSFAEVGAALGTSENNAAKRVTRAVEKLRDIFKRRSVALSTAAIATAISARAVQTAPTALANSIAKAVAGLSLPVTIGGTTPGKMLIMALLLSITIATVLLFYNRPSTAPPQNAHTTMAQAKMTPPLLQATASDHTKSHFTVTPLAMIPGFVSARAEAVNNNGQVVGWAETADDITHAFLWENGTTTDLGTFGASESLASDINDAGEIVGTMILNGERHAFLWSHGAATDLGVIDQFAHLGGAQNYNPGIAINAFSQVAGRLQVEGGNTRSFLWNKGVTTYFGLLGHGEICYTDKINRHGQMVGQTIERDGHSHAFLWDEGRVTNLGTLGGTRASATSLNDAGVVIGWSTVQEAKLDEAHAFVWKNGVMQDLGTLQGKASRAYGINNAGQVVGYVMFSNDHSAAFLWENNQMWNLNDLVPTNSGWRLTGADSINDRGQIVAMASNGKERHAVLLSPGVLPTLPSTETRLASLPPKPRVLASVPLNLLSFQHLPRGGFRLAFAGKADGNYFVEASTNLVQWTRLGPGTNENGRIEFTDVEATNLALRFYRVVRAP